jgi:hypothetical protein
MNRQQPDGTDQDTQERYRNARIPETWLTDQDGQGA